MIKNSELLSGNDIFKNSYFKQHAKELHDLAINGQHPKALFIGCADSRVVPNLITQSNPGDLFVVRNVGNFVAPYKLDEDFHSTAAGIEYAVLALEVKEIIICGHTHCGAIEALYTDMSDSKMLHAKKWLSLGTKAKNLALLSLGKDAEKKNLLRLTEKLSIVFQIENLLSYPFIKEKVEAEEINIHGWVYDIESGNIEFYDPDESVFKSLNEVAGE